MPDEPVAVVEPKDPPVEPTTAPEVVAPAEPNKKDPNYLPTRFGGGIRGRYKYPRYSATAISEALIAARYDRAMAAKALKVPKQYITNRINSNKQLKASFGQRMVQERINQDIDRLRMTGHMQPEVVDLMTKQADEFAVGQGQVAKIAIARLLEIQERLKKGNKARELQGLPVEQRSEEDKIYIAKHAFNISEIEDEEKKLFAQEQAMMQEHSRSLESFGMWAYKKAQIEQIMRKLGPMKDPRKPQAAPPKEKSKAPNITHITDSNVVIQQPAQPALDKSNDTGTDG